MTRPSPRPCTFSKCDFAGDYEVGQLPLMLEIEQRVRGSAYGATSWTTRAQSEATAHRLGLGTGWRLLACRTVARTAEARDLPGSLSLARSRTADAANTPEGKIVIVSRR
jgi:hypothetical protein